MGGGERTERIETGQDVPDAVIHGVPKAIRDKLAKLGITRDFDLILHLPLRYVDETHLYPIREAPLHHTVQVEGVVVQAEVRFRPRRQLVCLIEDATGSLYLRLIHFYPNQVKALQTGARVRLLGEIRQGFLGLEMVHPQFRVVKEAAPLKENLTPVYPTTAGLSQASLRALVAKALARADLADTLPEGVRRELELMEFSAAVRYLHEPPPDASLAGLEARDHPAWQRLKFDELLAQQLSMRRHAQLRRSRGAPVLNRQGELTARLRARLPFRLTAAQERVVAEIARDLAQPHPMHRLLQGDVGSGKTVVAALACAQAMDSGWQAAVMAPTEILAEQHYRKLADWFEPLGVRVAWLSASVSRKERAEWLRLIAQGEAPLAVGTHALFQEEVEFARLGLAVVDEQHRFGVAQRLALHNKGMNPHQLMMSATPIPRTLAMSYYADLDLSVIDELPPGRTPVLTKLVDESRRDEVIARIRAACREGRQAYWVCPLVEESEKLQLKAAQATYASLAASFPELRVGLVHGRMGVREKAEVMEAFKAGAIDLLVATTVIEVGVDVPNASLMVIEHAERMGLSQLHQLRGRVGRGAAASVCILLYQQPLSETARARLKIIYESADGFEIARQDLALRGPGEFLGARQSGLPMLRIADPTADEALMQAARDLAPRLLKRHPEAVERHLSRWLPQAEEYMKA
ncbi:ATP-dependent DNA helicase RecG [Thiobacter aerophilum]|uniref:ATP-dependent DNA helicase RecG n=1 Tax=Thiobacter aerophilum TaxID=3121275 RepID=UPI003D2FBFB9